MHLHVYRCVNPLSLEKFIILSNNYADLIVISYYILIDSGMTESQQRKKTKSISDGLGGRGRMSENR